jgi:hypothetical protein
MPSPAPSQRSWRSPRRRPSLRATPPVAALAASLACATVGTQTPAGTPAEQPSPGPPATAGWSVRTRQHVDLWLHGYGLLQRDTARVPFFRRGYRDRMLAERRRLGITTALDENATA